MVEVPEFPIHPYDLPVFFKGLVDNYFKVYSITDEDRKKTLQYKANASRAQEQRNYSDFTDFLRSLNLKMTIEPANDYNIQRIAQMTQKTNQFNLTTHRYTDADIRQFMKDGWKIWCLSVADKFGDNGITGCVLVNGDVIDTLLLSCRILGKGIEKAFIKKILAMLKESGVQAVKADYLPTAKNAQVKDFYDRCGFPLVSEEADGKRSYILDLKDADLTIKEYYHINLK